MNLAKLIGLIAAACTTLAFIPQVARSWRTRATADLSLGMCLVMTTGIGLWLVYGLMIHDLPLILANIVTFLFSLALLLLKLRHG